MHAEVHRGAGGALEDAGLDEVGAHHGRLLRREGDRSALSCPALPLLQKLLGACLAELAVPSSRGGVWGDTVEGAMEKHLDPSLTELAHLQP